MAPPVDDVFTDIRASAKFVADNADHVKINYDKLKEFANSLSPDDVPRDEAKLPLKFDTLEQEITFFGVLALLNLGSGFRKDLHQMCRRGAYETIQTGLISMHLTRTSIEAGGLATMQSTDIAENFQIPCQKLGAHPDNPAFEVSSPTSLAPLVEMLTSLSNDAGRKLQEIGCSSFGQFVLKVILPAKQGDKPRGADLVRAISNTIPGFDDTAEYKGRTIYFYKKSQFLAFTLYRRFQTVDPARFDFGDASSFTVFADNVVPCVLRTLGILEYSKELAEAVDSGKFLEAKGAHEVEMRSCAIWASEEITVELNARHPGVPAADVDLMLWRKGKEDGFRKVDRHISRDTVYY